VAALWASLEEANTPMMAAAVRLLLLLGQRAAETVNGLRWDALALKGDPPTWTLPGSFWKGGRLHVVPLPPLAVRIIEELRPITGDKARVLHRVGEQNAERLWWGPARERALAEFQRRGLPAERFTRHDLRRTAGTGIVRLTGNRFIMQRALGHAESGVGPIYDRHAYLREKYAALCAWADHVEALVSAARKEQVSA